MAIGEAKNAKNGETVAGYFANGDDARNALHELADAGFDSKQAGAAFHSSALGGPSAPFYEQAVNDLPIHAPGGPNASNGGPQSDTHAVTPWGLTTWGSGTPFTGSPTEPPPIPGAETPSRMPREIPRELPSDSDERGPSQHESAHDYPYSSAALEGSFSGMGIPPEQARRFARELGRGGAVVTVNAGQKARAVEDILKRHHGTIQYESAQYESAPVAAEPATERGRTADERVHVYGEVHRVYPGYVPMEHARERKAS